MIIEFDFEGRDQGAAFFALYAGLRMYKEVKENQIKASSLVDENKSTAISVPAMEAYGMMCDLEEQFPNYFKEAEQEYNENY